VTSAVLQLDALDRAPFPPDEEERVLRMVRNLFTHRRKTLLNALSYSFADVEKSRLLAALQQARIDPVRRTETLTLEEFLALSRALVL